MHTPQPLTRVLAANLHRALLAWVVLFEIAWGVTRLAAL